jgi:hypothetical protein
MSVAAETLWQRQSIYLRWVSGIGNGRQELALNDKAQPPDAGFEGATNAMPMKNACAVFGSRVPERSQLLRGIHVNKRRVTPNGPGSRRVPSLNWPADLFVAEANPVEIIAENCSFGADLTTGLRDRPAPVSPEPKARPDQAPSKRSNSILETR